MKHYLKTTCKDMHSTYIRMYNSTTHRAFVIYKKIHGAPVELYKVKCGKYDNLDQYLSYLEVCLAQPYTIEKLTREEAFLEML